MLSTPHVIVGAAIATKVTNPILAIPLAFASHMVLEMVPHWNPHLNTEMRTYGHLTKKTMYIIAADTALAGISAIVLTFALGNTVMQQANIMACCLAAIAPDLMEAPYFFLHKKNQFLTFWLKFQKSIQSDADPIVGLATQVVTTAAAILWIVK